MTNLISAEEARAASSSYDLTADQVIAQLAHVISSNASLGQKSITQSFSSRSVSPTELEVAVQAVRSKGYDVSTKPNTSSPDETFVVVSW
jgi:hypothetical protein